jgi:hypothetical protein
MTYPTKKAFIFNKLKKSYEQWDCSEVIITKKSYEKL